MAIGAMRCAANHHHPIPEHAETEDSSFSVVLARIFRLKVGRLEDEPRVLKIKLPFGESLGALRRIAGDGHKVFVSRTTTVAGKDVCRSGSRLTRGGSFMALVGIGDT
jgi:hypothetical protein